jgi:multiple sugar transport system permease protein
MKKIDTYTLKRKSGSTLIALMRTVFLLGIGFYIRYPLFLKLMASFVQESDIFDATVSVIPKNFTMENFKLVFKTMHYPKAFFNTLLLSTLVMVLQIASSLLVGYGFGKFDFPCKKLLFALGVFMLVVPPQIIVFPLYLNYVNFDIFGLFTAISGKPISFINTYFPFIFSSAFCTGTQGMMFVFMFRQYFRGVPKEIEEAARVDGAGELLTFVRIMVPSSVPVTVCVSVLSFIWQWNDIFWTSRYLRGTDLLSVNLYTLSASITSQIGESNLAYKSILNSAGAIMLILPLVIAYMFVQKLFIQSVERSGIVG